MAQGDHSGCMPCLEVRGTCNRLLYRELGSRVKGDGASFRVDTRQVRLVQAKGFGGPRYL